MDDAAYHHLESLIWSSNYRALPGLPLAPKGSWVNAVQTEFLQFGADTNLDIIETTKIAYLNAAVVLMVKDESDIIGFNLSWLYSIGLRRFVIIDNASIDNTAIMIADFQKIHPSAEVITIFDHTVAHFQAEKTTAMARFAGAFWPGIQWILPVDADEFLIPRKSLAALDQVGMDVDSLVIPKIVHFRSRTAVETTAAGPMHDMPLRTKLFAMPPKIVLRAHPMLKIEQGNHYANWMDGNPVRYAGGFRHGFYIREFPNRSFQHLVQKIRNGARAIRAAQATGRQVGGDHWLAFDAKLQSEGESGLLEDYHHHWLKDPGEDFICDPFIVPIAGEPAAQTHPSLV